MREGPLRDRVHHHYVELACIVRGASATTVNRRLDTPSLWSAYSPASSRAHLELETYPRTRTLGPRCSFAGGDSTGKALRQTMASPIALIAL